jgi:hypothetical protein
MKVWRVMIWPRRVYEEGLAAGGAALGEQRGQKVRKEAGDCGRAQVTLEYFSHLGFFATCAHTHTGQAPAVGSDARGPTRLRDSRGPVAACHLHLTEIAGLFSKSGRGWVLRHRLQVGKLVDDRVCR